jgi:hypothetical protein
MNWDRKKKTCPLPNGLLGFRFAKHKDFIRSPRSGVSAARLHGPLVFSLRLIIYHIVQFLIRRAVSSY